MTSMNVRWKLYQISVNRFIGNSSYLMPIHDNNMMVRSELNNTTITNHRFNQDIGLDLSNICNCASRIFINKWHKAIQLCVIVVVWHFNTEQSSEFLVAEYVCRFAFWKHNHPSDSRKIGYNSVLSGKIINLFWEMQK